MPDPVTPLTREQVETMRYDADHKERGQAKAVVIQRLCDSHEALRAETEALRQERNGSVARTPEPPPFTREPSWQPMETAPKSEMIEMVAANGKILRGCWGDYSIHNTPGFVLWRPVPTREVEMVEQVVDGERRFVNTRSRE